MAEEEEVAQQSEAPPDVTDADRPRYDATNDDAVPDPEDMPSPHSANYAQLDDAQNDPNATPPHEAGSATSGADSPDEDGDSGETVTLASSSPSGEAPSGKGWMPSYRSLLGGGALALGGGALMAGTWQAVLHSHAKLDSAGNPLDETGKAINLRDMNPEFGQKLAQTFTELDAAGYHGEYRILSGVRTHEEQAYLYNKYEGGRLHPVAAPGTSPHEFGIATDIQYTGNGSREVFYAKLHEIEARNGLATVANDPNHVQIADAHNYIAQLRQQQSSTQMASMQSPRVDRSASAGL